MSNYPGDIPLRGSIGFIMFDDLKEYIVTIPQGAVLRAWPKLRELERRWLYFEWFTHGVAKKPEGFRSLLDDAASAYLMTFEAVIQMMGDQFGQAASQLTAWLEALPPDVYDLTCRGLRTLRNIEAHVRPGNLESWESAWRIHLRIWRGPRPHSAVVLHSPDPDRATSHTPPHSRQTSRLADASGVQSRSQGHARRRTAPLRHWAACGDKADRSLGPRTLRVTPRVANPTVAGGRRNPAVLDKIWTRWEAEHTIPRQSDGKPRNPKPAS